MTYDILIQHGTVIDGTGQPRYQADVGVQGGRIAAVGDLSQATAARVIDATGLVVAPGFIDMHTHSDVTLLDDPGGESMAHQGVTTQVTGNCSFSPFPSGEGGIRDFQRRMGSLLPSRIQWQWTDLDGWATFMEQQGVSLNVAPLVGHSALRVAAGAVDDWPPASFEMKTMQRLAAEAVEQGAFGLSTGLTLPPSSYATTDEIVELVKAIAPYPGAFYATHARVWAGWHVKAIQEAVEVGQRAGVPVQYSHIAIIDKRAYGSGEEMVHVIEAARAQGLDATMDAYPYTAAGTPLSQLVPEWIQAGGIPAMLERLRDPAQRAKARADTAKGWFGGMPWEWDRLVIAQVRREENKPLVGRSVAEIAQLRQADPADTLLALIDEEDNYVAAVMHNRIESDARFFLSHPLVMIGSDGRAVSPHGLYGSARPHPRFYGTYPRVLGRYVRDESVMSLEAAIFKMTAFPATRLGLRERGRVAEGLAADLALFDPATVADRATFEDPQQYPIGIPYVLVSGVPIVDGGVHTGARPGRVLRRGAA